MTEGQPKGGESLLFKTLVAEHLAYLSIVPATPVWPEYCAYRGGSRPGAAASHPDNRY